MHIMQNYIPSKKLGITNNPIRTFIMHDARYTIESCIGSNDIYKIQGSAGQGNLAEIPWIGVFDRDITVTAQKGYDIVYLFRADMTGVYLSLNQGWTFFRDTYGTSEGKIRIKQNALGWRNILLSALEDFSCETIDLGSTGILGKGYELGHICGIYYSLDEMPSNEVLRSDLIKLLGVYRELKGNMPNYKDIEGTVKQIETIQSVTEELDDIKFQNRIDTVNPKYTSEEPQPKPTPVKRGNRKSWPRDPAISKGALIRANYMCENNVNHITFTSKTSGQNYVEAHHLIPMKLQSDFENSLDVTGNILSLCPTCHSIFHHATYEEKAKIIEKLYIDRIDQLKVHGINISLEDLKQSYK